MTRRCLLPAIVLLLLAAPAARAAESILKAIPNGALTFAVVNRLAETDAKIQQTAAQLQLPVPGMLNVLKAASGIQAGVDEKGAAAIVLMPPKDIEKDDEPLVLLLLPLTDFAKFLAPLSPEDATAKIVKVTIFGGPYLAAQRGGYAVLADTESEAMLAKLIESEGGVAKELAPLSAWLDGNDVAGVVTRKGVEFFTTIGIRELRKTKSQFDDMPEELQESMGTMIAVFDFYEKILEGTGREVAAAAAGARLEKSGDLQIASRVRLVADGVAARALAGAKPLSTDPLAQLPSEPFVVAAAGAFPESLVEPMTQFSVQFMRSGVFPFGGFGGDTDKWIEMSRQSMKNVRGMAMMLGVGGQDDPLYGRMIASIQVKDSASYMQQYREAMEAFVKAQKKNEDSALPPMEVEDTRVGDVEGLKFSMGIPLPPGMDDVPEFREMMEQMMDKMYGNDGKIVIYLAPANKQTVVMGYTSPEPALAAMRTVKNDPKGLAGDPQLAAAAKLLPSDALGTFYWSPKGTVAFAKRAVAVFSAMGGGGGPDFPDFPDAPAIGAAVTKAPNELRVDAAVPAKTLEVGAAYILKLMALGNAL